MKLSKHNLKDSHQSFQQIKQFSEDAHYLSFFYIKIEFSFSFQKDMSYRWCSSIFKKKTSDNDQSGIMLQIKQPIKISHFKIKMIKNYVLDLEKRNWVYEIKMYQWKKSLVTFIRWFAVVRSNIRLCSILPRRIFLTFQRRYRSQISFFRLQWARSFILNQKEPKRKNSPEKIVGNSNRISQVFGEYSLIRIANFSSLLYSSQ